jgi:hypothetical protein
MFFLIAEIPPMFLTGAIVGAWWISEPGTFNGIYQSEWDRRISYKPGLLLLSIFEKVYELVSISILEFDQYILIKSRRHWGHWLLKILKEVNLMRRIVPLVAKCEVDISTMDESSLNYNITPISAYSFFVRHDVEEWDFKGHSFIEPDHSKSCQHNGSILNFLADTDQQMLAS